MPNPVHLWQTPDAAQQSRPPPQGRSKLGRALRRLGRCSAITLVAVVLSGATPPVREFDISIQGRHVLGGSQTLRVTRGEIVLMRWRADEQVALHIHGYDIQANLSPDAPTVIRFAADVAGRFPIEAHRFGPAAMNDDSSTRHHDVTLLYLEVLPE
jgi:hypothetical protein